MQSINIRNGITKLGSTGCLGLTVVALVGCLQGETTSTTGPGPVTPSGSAALQGQLAFVNNRDSKTLSVVGIDGQGSLRMISTMGTANEFAGYVLGDMQVSSGEWVFMNLTAGNKVATIDPLSGATPIHEANLPVGTRPVHMYRDPTDGEIIWSMNDGDATNGDDSER
ncbi:MAG: hypothetical protein OEY28_14120 [Nitrospira sp.]|nr:hypothetical protein [Nitrospira sp.]